MNLYNLFPQGLPPATQIWSLWLRECWPPLLVELVLAVIFAWAVYMFYARLRDIADEMKMLRVAYENSHSPVPKPATHQPPAAHAQAPATNDGRYMPKKWAL